MHGTGGNQFDANNVTMPLLARSLRRPFGVNVTDATGLTNSYDYSLGFPRPATPEEIKRALEEQLGLELTPATDEPGVDFIVVEKTK